MRRLISLWKREEPYVRRSKINRNRPHFCGVGSLFDQPDAAESSWTDAGAVHGYHLTLYDQNGNVTQRYDLGPNDIVSDDPIHQNIRFRVGGQEKSFHGSYQKERY